MASDIKLDGDWVQIEGSLQFLGTQTPMIFIYRSGTANPERAIIAHSPNFTNWGLFYQDQGDKMIFRASGQPVLVVNLGEQNVGIGIDNPSDKLHVNGSVTATEFKSVSDQRLKTNVTGCADALGKVLQLRGVEFEWDQAAIATTETGQRRRIGFIAQEVQSVLPEAVSQDNQGTYSVAYSTIVPLLTEAIKEQQRIIASQTETIDQLKTDIHDATVNNASANPQLASMEARIAQLEGLVSQLAGAAAS